MNYLQYHTTYKIAAILCELYKPLAFNHCIHFLACAMLVRLLDPGTNAPTIQFGATRQIQSSFFNVFHASVHDQGLSTMGDDRSKLHFSDCPTQSLWFIRLVWGCHCCMGDTVRQDMALSVVIIHLLNNKLYADYQEAVGLTSVLLVISKAKKCHVLISTV